ncbi:uncharacterized protein PHACADRAFT_170567 [Phanerochaete carnosa HHB-10118-sp]|uniref:DUF1857-domain-containing protein n=1 Tax=Phanerochaete carnosa (strain HHB-10118-sp) TaxID=650164 RepID=K5WLC7_PHACS|nr:uncharacterized protein PHACADRAFT_170567 [Phanerochaete carnosa HHB-10118-sp]EKM59984.1 hypothetical protein PHACADRAFT_170567 [Phanerochaete carnosa HHB-10118-sp]
MKIYLASTAPINPANVPSKLTRAQVWEGLKIKAHSPFRFVPIIEKCRVVEEHGTGLTCVVQFGPGTGPPGKTTEVVTFGGEVYVRILQTFTIGLRLMFGSHRQNPNGRCRDRHLEHCSDGDGETDLYLTYNHTWNFPEIHPGSPEEKEKREQMKWSINESMAVAVSINELRDLVQEGEVEV